MKHNQRNTTKKKAFWGLALALVAGLSLWPAPARAHEGMEHLKGTVVSVADNVLTVKPSKGSKVEVHVDAKTEYSKGKQEAKLSDIKAGDKVVIHTMKMNGKLVAHEVELAPGQGGTPAVKKP